MVKLRPRQQLAVCLAAVLLSAGAYEGGDEPEEPAPVTDRVTYLTGFGTFGREGFVRAQTSNDAATTAADDFSIVPSSVSPVAVLR